MTPTSGLDQALACVMCGICVPHCPTFGLSQNEADGPRGRISLMLGLRSGDLTVDDGVIQHLDSCLACRACEDVCPSKVPYGDLIDTARAVINQDQQPETNPDHLNVRANLAPWHWLRDQVLTHRGRMRHLWSLARLTQRSGLGKLVAKLPNRTVRTLWQTLPNASTSALPRLGTSKPDPAQTPSSKGRIGLFIGCTGEAMNAAAAAAAQRVLTRLGYEVVVPRAQACCGAMHRHGGEPDRADALATKNRQTFEAEAIDTIVVVGSGCAAELQEQLPETPIREVTAFLAELQDSDWPALSSNDDAVAVHVPCSQMRVLGEADSPTALLQRIPGIKLQTLASNDRCCGAAGMHVLLYPEQAQQLRAPKLSEVQALRPSYLASANVGCAMHLAAGLAGQDDGQGIEVLHPVELIDRALAG